MAYVKQSRTFPAGSQIGADFATSALANDKALQDQILIGMGEGWTYSQSGGTAEEPATILLTNTTNTNVVFKTTLTWDSGNITVATFSLSTTGSGGTFDAIGSAGFTYDGNGNLTDGTGFGGLLLKLLELRGKHKALKTTYDAHAAATGTAVHGLGTMATQAAGAVNIDGGSIDGTTIGTATSAEGFFTRAIEQWAMYSPALNASVTIDWNKGGSYVTTSGMNTLSFQNIASSNYRIATHALFVTNFSYTTFPGAVSWGAGGKPSIGGKALVQLASFDGGTTVYGIVAWREV